MPTAINLRQAVFALADALDLVGIDEVQHGKRVAYMALACARRLGMDTNTQRRLFHAALLHDCGVSSSRMHERLIGGLDWEGAHEHCEVGYALLKDFAPLADLADIIRYHHTHWRDRPAHLDADTARLANLVYLADRADALAAPYYGSNIFVARRLVREKLRPLAGDLFEPGLLATFLDLSATEAFWWSLEPRHLDHFMLEMESESEPIKMGMEAMGHLAYIFARIVDAKSPYTRQHSEGVARLARRLGEWTGLPPQQCEKLEIAGLLHDLGKLRVPDEILDKHGPLNEAEWDIMQRHSFETWQILRRIQGLEDVATWAGYHHEALDGSGYPFRVGAAQMSIETRIIAVADIFQAFAQDRPYRAGLSAREILAYLEQAAARGTVDADVVALIAEHLDESWAAACATGPCTSCAMKGPAQEVV